MACSQKTPTSVLQWVQSHSFKQWFACWVMSASAYSIGMPAALNIGNKASLRITFCCTHANLQKSFVLQNPQGVPRAWKVEAFVGTHAPGLLPHMPFCVGWWDKGVSRQSTSGLDPAGVLLVRWAMLVANSSSCFPSCAYESNIVRMTWFAGLERVHTAQES